MAGSWLTSNKYPLGPVFKKLRDALQGWRGANQLQSFKYLTKFYYLIILLNQFSLTQYFDISLEYLNIVI